MGQCADLEVNRTPARWLCAAFLGLAAILSLPLTARAQDTAIITRGDAAVTAFSGARQLGEVPPDLHPLDRTFIDVNGATLQVFDLTDLGGPADGQIANAPTKFQATAGEIGQVYGVALDGDSANATPNIYVTSTSLFGLQIVTAEGDRLVKGEPGARWMPGQFGLDKGGTPGSVWKIDGATGIVSLFANIQQDGKDNAGPGLGAIAYDPATKQFFVSDLETGLIHRLGLDGSDGGTFDHGTAGRAKAGLEPVAYDAASRMSIESPKFDIENPASWGFADKRRAVFAVAVQDKRLYYSVAEGPEIWSVGLNDDGSFADDARREIEVTRTPNGNVITAIVFDGAGTLYLAQRGEIAGSYDYSVFAKPEASDVLRYAWDETAQRWSDQPDEYAIGLKDPHRSTEGGIALNYGYDADGKIDYDQCRATLWTTGEHLREGADENRVFQGGARIVHGLQGNDKSLVRPANVPPYQTWFVDNDGLFLDGDAYGHVGDIAIFNPCDKRTIAEPVPLPYPLPVPYYPPLPEPGPFPPPHAGPGIFIDKLCDPEIFGGEIHCTITVTNVGETLSDAIDIWDAATILAGPGAGGGVIIAGVAPDGPDWICSPTPTPDLWCSLPPDALEPGETRSIDVWIDTGPLFGAGDFGFRNCATLEGPWDDFACDDGGTDIIVRKTAPAACDPAADCTFTITIANGGTLGFDGDVLITDSMFDTGGAPLGAPITVFAPALCVPPPGGLAFSCVAHLTLAPGESEVFSMTVTMPGLPPAYWAENCFAVSAPGLPAPALPLAPGAHSATTSCAWVPVGGPPPLSNLRMDKTALHDGDCYKTGAGDIACDYEIAIINDGPSPYHGPLSFTDDIPATATLTPLPAPWVCIIGAPPIPCGAVGPFDIPSGGSITVPVTVTTPLAPLEAAGCGMPNTATITVPVGPDANFFAGDDADTATADAFLFWDLPWGGVIVTCDPTNLKTTKVAKGDFVAADGGYRGEYVVTITNMGPDPYKGPIKVSDQFGFAPTSVQFSAPWGCTGGGASFTCTHPHVELNKGDSVELTITVKVADGPACKLKNSAVMTVPPAHTRFNGDAGDDAASATAKIPSKNCVEPKRPQCEPGANEYRSESGACVCKSRFLRDEKGQCVIVVEQPRCPDGKPVPKSGRCPVTPPLCEPGNNEERNAQNQCVCLKGFERDKRGRCVEEQNPGDECTDKGWLWNDKTKTCTPPSTGPTPCVPGPHEERNAQNQCVCLKGFERDKNGRCVESTSPEDECEEKGWLWDDKRDRCLPPTNPPEECTRKGWTWDSKHKLCLSPEDVCKLKGWNWDGERCSPPPEPGPECRKKGWIWDGKRCLSPADACKLKGWNWDGERCSPPPEPGPECRKKGWIWDGKRCLSPADACKLKGWNWDGERCSPPTTPAEECRKTGGLWDGKRKVCLSPADICKAKGGEWDGKSCQHKTDPAVECRKGGGVWNGRSCLSPADVCKAKGGEWDGKSCQPKANPAVDCRKNGGIWNGTTCLSPADACKAKGWNWDGKSCKPPATNVPRLTVPTVPKITIPAIPKNDVPR